MRRRKKAWGYVVAVISACGGEPGESDSVRGDVADAMQRDQVVARNGSGRTTAAG